MTDGNWIFDAAIRLMDEQNARNGETNTADTAEYRHRTLTILNVLRHELYPVSGTFEAELVCPELKSMEQPLNLDDDLAQTVLPYGLAAHLLLGENHVMAAFFQQRYTELLRTLGGRRMARWENIQTQEG